MTNRELPSICPIHKKATIITANRGFPSHSQADDLHAQLFHLHSRDLGRQRNIAILNNHFLTRL